MGTTGAASTSVRIFKPTKDETYATNAKYIAFGYTHPQLSVVAMYCDCGVGAVEAVPEDEKRSRVLRVEPEYEYYMSFLDEEEKRMARIENERRQAALALREFAARDTKEKVAAAHTDHEAAGTSSAFGLLLYCRPVCLSFFSFDNLPFFA